MKRILFIIAVAGFCNRAQATLKAYDIEAQVVRGAEVISDAHILSSNGKTVSIAQQNDDGEVTLLEVTTSSFKNSQTASGVLLKIQLSSLINGKKTRIATSMVMTLPGQATDVSFGKGLEQYRMSVIAQPISIKNARRIIPAGTIDSTG